MPIAASDITIVFQGPVVGGPEGTARLIRLTRRALLHSPIILSTWIGTDLADIDVDTVLLSEDPGTLPGIKRRDGPGEPNNINRQIVSTQAGVQKATTRYTLKLRTDCALERTAFLTLFDRLRRHDGVPRIVASSLFTIDPWMFEQLPYHVSDWVQFGETPALQTYWSLPYMAHQDATYYERHPHARHSTFLDRRFRTRWAVEQYLAMHYARHLGFPMPAYHNDIAPAVLAGHRHFLARHVLILDPWDMGLRFPKYAWAYRSSFQRLNCVLFLDWYRLFLEEGGRTLQGMPSAEELHARLAQKRVARLLGRYLDKAGPLLLRPGIKQVANRLLALLTGHRRAGAPRLWSRECNGKDGALPPIGVV